jgi:hypothetical protein
MPTIKAVLTTLICLIILTGTVTADAAPTPTVPRTLPRSPVKLHTPIQRHLIPVNNSVITYDTTGARIDAHDGKIVQDPTTGVSYLFGTAYGCGYAFTSPTNTPWCGVKVYRSTNLATWTPAGSFNGVYAFDPTTPEYQNICDSSHYGCFEPHPARRPDGTWVMWINSVRYTAGYIVLTAPSPGGPYTRMPDPILALGPAQAGLVGYGAEDITVDPTDPSLAYLTYTMLGAGHDHQIAVERLDPTWTTGTGDAATVPGEHVEAPAMFKHGALWYVTYSDPACPYCNNAGTSYSTATTPLGTWVKRGTPWPTSCAGQPTGVNIVNGRYIYQSDRWAQKPGGGFQPNQYTANNYLAPLTFDIYGNIPAQPCMTTWTL